MTREAAREATSTGRARNELARIRAIYDKMSGSYDRSIGFWETVLFGDGRAWIGAQARGDVLEVAVGTGRSLSFYSAQAQLTGVELSPAMLEIARGRGRQLGRAVDLRVGDAQTLDFPDASFDTVVFSLALCTIPDARRAIAEAVRVLRPGGQLLWLEHVRSPVLPVRMVQRVLEPIFVRLEADHMLREPLDYLATEGLEVERLERSKWGLVERGLARKPARG